jgi:dihydroflavonol-4-reductase
MGKKGRVYLAGGDYISLKELAKIVSPSKIPLSIPVDLLLSFLPLINIYDKLFHLKWPVTRESLITLKFSPKNIDSSRAIRELGHQTRPIKQTLDDLVTWFNENKTK